MYHREPRLIVPVEVFLAAHAVVCLIIHRSSIHWLHRAGRGQATVSAEVVLQKKHQ